MKPTVLPLTEESALYIAERLCPSHREDILREYSSVGEWAKSRLSLPGSAWMFVKDRPLFAGGLVTRGNEATMWLAGCEGWTQSIRHALRITRAVLKSGAYERYTCEVRESDTPARRFAERLGFGTIDVRSGIVFYEVTP